MILSRASSLALSALEETGMADKSLLSSIESEFHFAYKLVPSYTF